MSMVLNLLRALQHELAGMTVLTNRAKTIGLVLKEVETKLANHTPLPSDALSNLESRLHDIYAILRRLRFSDMDSDVVRLHMIVQAVEEKARLDSTVGRLEVAIDELNLFARVEESLAVKSLLIERRVEDNDKRDSKQLMDMLLKMFANGGKSFGQMAKPLADAIGKNNAFRRDPSQFLGRVSFEMVALAELTVKLLDQASAMVNREPLPFPDDDDDRLNQPVQKAPTPPPRRKREEKGEEEAIVPKVLGRGEFGPVFAGNWQGVMVAYKTAPIHPNLSIRARTEFRNDIEMWKSLDHKNVAKMYGMCVREMNRYIVMEQCDISLEGLLRGDFEEFPLDDATSQSIAKGMARGLSYLHEQSILHRNLRPKSVLLGGDDRSMVKLANFGFEVTKEETRGRLFASRRNSTQSFRESGLAYLAPELFQSKDMWTFAGDVYALGVIMWEITQKGAYPYEDERSKNAGIGLANMMMNEGLRPFFSPDIQVPRWMRGVIESCWRSERFERPRARRVVQVIGENQKQIDAATNGGGRGRYTIRPQEQRSVKLIANMLEKTLPDGMNHLPKRLSLQASTSVGIMVERLHEHYNDEEFVNKTCMAIVECLRKHPQATLNLEDHEALELVVKIMQLYGENADIQAYCAGILRYSSLSTRMMEHVHELGADLLLIENMKVHGGSVLVQFYGCLVLGNAARRLKKEMVNSLVERGAVEQILQSMRVHGDKALVQKNGCWALNYFMLQSGLEKRMEYINENGMASIIVGAMERYASEHDLQIYGLGALLNASADSPEIVALLVRFGAAFETVRAMKTHPDDGLVQEYACELVNTFVTIKDAAKEMIKDNVIETIMLAMSKHLSNDSYQASAWNALEKLTTIASCIPHLLSSMKDNPYDVSIQKTGCILVQSLAATTGNQERLVKGGALEILLAILEEHWCLPYLLSKACTAIMALACDQKSAKTLVNARGVELIIAAMERNSQSLQLQEAACGALASLIKVGAMPPAPPPAIHRERSQDEEKEDVVIPLVDDIDELENAILDKAPAQRQQDELQTHHALEQVIIAMSNHPAGASKLHVNALWMISELADWEEADEIDHNGLSELIDFGTVEAVVRSMTNHANTMDVQQYGCKTLGRLAHDDLARERMLEAESDVVVLDALNNYITIPNVLEPALFALGRLAICSSCRNTHAEYQKTGSHTDKLEYFEWDDPSFVPSCTYDCANALSPRALSLTVEAFKSNSTNLIVRDSVVNALRALCIADKFNYANLEKMSKEDKELAVLLPWIDYTQEMLDAEREEERENEANRRPTLLETTKSLGSKAFDRLMKSDRSLTSSTRGSSRDSTSREPQRKSKKKPRRRTLLPRLTLRKSRRSVFTEADDEEDQDSRKRRGSHIEKQLQDLDLVADDEMEEPSTAVDNPLYLGNLNSPKPRGRYPIPPGCQ